VLASRLAGGRRAELRDSMTLPADTPPGDAPRWDRPAEAPGASAEVTQLHTNGGGDSARTPPS
jgi:hypothetical protein